MEKRIIYISAIDLSENSAQASFERNIISYITGVEELNKSVVFFTPNREILNAQSSFFVRRISKTPWGYFLFQFSLLFQIVGFLLRNSGHYVFYLRESGFLLTPVVIAKCWGISCCIRSGPGHINMVHYGKIKNKFFLRLYATYNHWFLRQFSKIIVVTERIKEQLISTYRLPSSRIVVIPNPVNDTLFRGIGSEHAQKNNKEIVFGYVGSVLEYQGLQTFVDAVSILNKKGVVNNEFRFLIVGGGDYLSQCKSRATAEGVAGLFDFTGEVSQSAIPNYMNKIDVAIATYTKAFNRIKGSSALKIWEYLYFDKYILCADIDDYLFIEEKEFGLTYEIENPHNMAEKMLKIKDGRLYAKKVSSRGFVERERSSAVIFSKYIQEINNI